jgi:predicted thioredoxin/glutaredoxin
MKGETIPFNAWSNNRIELGRKVCTSRKRIWNDSRVIHIQKLPWGFIRDYYWREEGADSPEELQKVVNRIFRRIVKDDELFYVHWGDFKKEASG